MDDSRDALLALGVLVFAIGFALAEMRMDKLAAQADQPTIATPILVIPPRSRARPSPAPYPAPGMVAPPGEPLPPSDPTPRPQ